MKVKFICLLIFVSIFLGCGEVEEGDDDTGGKASVINTHPAVGSEIENGSNLTITFDDEDQIEGKHISVSGVLLKVVGNQANWKVEGLSKGEQNSLMVVWTNTDGSNGSHVLVFQGKGKKDDGVVTENWYVPTGGNNLVGGGILIGDVDVGDVDVGDIEPKRTSVDNYLDLREEYAEIIIAGNWAPDNPINRELQAIMTGFYEDNPDCMAEHEERNTALHAKFVAGKINHVQYIKEVLEVSRLLHKCIGFSDLQYDRLLELDQRISDELNRRRKK